MKAKEKAILEAWNKIGVNFYIGICMETGYSEVQNENDISKILEYHDVSVSDIEWQHIQPAGLRYRPKSLQGIETNNSWIKIESEDNLPTDENFDYWACNGNHFYSLPYTCSELREDYKVNNDYFTHYQKIIRPNKPLY